MKKLLFTISLIIIMLSSCERVNMADFIITNNSDFQVDSLKIEPNANSENKYISLKPSEQVNYKTNMKGAGEGEYKLSFIINDEKKLYSFGYFTNSIQLDDVIIINIKNDTIDVKY